MPTQVNARLPATVQRPNLCLLLQPAPPRLRRRNPNLRDSAYGKCTRSGDRVTERYDHLRRLMYLLILVLAGTAPHSSVAHEEPVALMRAGDHVLVIRHALAPGFGDPPGFRLGDCTTQRNLSSEGRAQASAIGDWLRARGIERARVYSSQWCRCLETASLLGLGEVTELPALNSFFQRPQDRGPRLAALRDFLASRPFDDEPTVLVTHQVTISALSGEFAASGNGILMAVEPGGAVRAVAQLDFED